MVFHGLVIFWRENWSVDRPEDLLSSRAAALVSRVSRLCRSMLARACTPPTKSEEKETARSLVPTLRVDFHCRVTFPARKWNGGNVWKATGKRESWTRFIFNEEAWPSKHCLYFIFARKSYVRTHGKITRQWKSTLSSDTDVRRSFSPLTLTVKFVVSRCAFCKLRRSFGFFLFSVNHPSGPRRKHMFTLTSVKGHGLWLVIGGFRSVWLFTVLLDLWSSCVGL